MALRAVLGGWWPSRAPVSKLDSLDKPEALEGRLSSLVIPILKVESGHWDERWWWTNGRPNISKDERVFIAFDPGAGDRSGDELVGWLEETGYRRDPRMIPLPTHLALILADRP